jgi:hypothetical protein
VYLHDENQIMQHHLSPLLVKTLELGQEITSLADCAIKCLKRMFTLHRTISEKELISVIPALEKIINT